jgi:Phytanoyl-CoA dioxygenase (PhyH).
MSQFLSKKENNFYVNEGYLVRENQFSKDEVDSLREALERAVISAEKKANNGQVYYLDKKKFVDVGHITLQYEPQPSDNVLRVIEPAHSLDKELSSLIKDKRITDPVRSILEEEDISLWTDKLNLKRPGNGSGFGWHQDSPYWVHDNKNVDLLPKVICL